MKLSLEGKIALGFATAMLVVLTTGLAAWWNARRMNESYRWVDHTHEVRFAVESITVDLLNMQTAARGYVITGREKFLDPYNEAWREMPNSLDRLEKLMSDNPPQRALAGQLREEIDHVWAGFEGIIRLRRENRLDVDRDYPLLERSAENVERTRALIERISSEEQRLLRDRSSQAQRAAQRVVTVILTLVVLAAGALSLMLYFARRDYHLRLRAERELDDFFRLSLDPLCVVSPDGRFLRLNPAWEAVLGYPLDQMMGRPFIEFVHPDDVDRTMAEAASIGHGNAPVSFQNRYRARDGSWRWLEWSSASVPGTGQICAVARDITERKTAETRIVQLNDDLNAQNSELEAFSYSVSHDLRAPLRHMAGFARLLEQHSGSALDEKGRHYLTTITNAAAQMGRLIDDLLEFSRTARAPLARQPVDHGSLVSALIRSERLAAEPIDWRVDHLPVIPGDPALLRQVWTNLLANAAKYSRNAQPKPVVRVRAQQDNAVGEVVFSVEDNGVGFDPRYASRLFQVFSRLHDAREFEGTGIGLALVRRIVARHGGRTWATSELGAGAKFYFSLPLKPKSDSPPVA